MHRSSAVLLTCLLLTAACGGDDDDKAAADAAMADSIANAMAAAAADSANAAGDADLRAFFDQGPLPAGADRAAVSQRFGAAQGVRVRTEPNRHVDGAVDSLFTLVYENADVTVRRAQGNDLLERAIIRSNDRLGGAPALIGVSDLEIRERFGEPDEAPDGNFLYRCDSCSELGGNAVVFHLGKGGTVEAVEIRYPVD